MVDKWCGTFQWWDTYPPGEVKQIPVSELGDYQSSYTHMYNYLRERGWVRENNKWTHKEKNRTFPNIIQAYEYQIYFLEKVK